MTESKKIAITGANGFLGQHTIRAAVLQEWDVIGIVRREEVIKEIEKLGAKPFLVKNFDIDNLEKAFKGCKAVIHFANVVCGSKKLFEEVNIEKACDFHRIETELFPKSFTYRRLTREPH